MDGFEKRLVNGYKWRFNMKKLIFLLKNVKDWFNSIFYHRDPSIVLFGAWFGERFADNSRNLYQYLFTNKEQYGLSHVVWVTRSADIMKEMLNMGYEVYMMESEESIFYHKKALYHIICNSFSSGEQYSGDINSELSFGAKKINLWHGVMPLKGVMYTSTSYKKKRLNHPIKFGIKEFIMKHSSIYRTLFDSPGGWGNCYYLSSTDKGTKTLMNFFLLPKNHMIETNQPRVAIRPKLTICEESIIDSFKKYQKVVLYMPTFRDEHSTFRMSNVSASLSSYLIDENVLWIQKAHSADNNKIDTTMNNNILNLPSYFDANVLIPFIDALVTDYSSIAADAMYYYKPVVYYVPDYSEYINSERGFLEKPEDIMIGDICKDKESLIQSIRRTNNPAYINKQMYSMIIDKYWGKNVNKIVYGK